MLKSTTQTSTQPVEAHPQHHCFSSSEHQVGKKKQAKNPCLKIAACMKLGVAGTRPHVRVVLIVSVTFLYMQRQFLPKVKKRSAFRACSVAQGDSL